MMRCVVMRAAPHRTAPHVLKGSSHSSGFSSRKVNTFLCVSLWHSTRKCDAMSFDEILGARNNDAPIP